MLNTLKDVSTQTHDENAHDENFSRQYGSNEVVTLKEVVTFDDSGDFDDDVFHDEIIVVDTVGGEDSGAQPENSPYAGVDNGGQVTRVVAGDASGA